MNKSCQPWTHNQAMGRDAWRTPPLEKPLGKLAHRRPGPLLRRQRFGAFIFRAAVEMDIGGAVHRETVMPVSSCDPENERLRPPKACCRSPDPSPCIKPDPPC